jgi:thiol-disulfide isomerase/thioredoxin
LQKFGAPHGTTFSVAGESADAIVLHFFASWCEPCREELPALKRLSDRGAPRLKVVAIAVADNDAPLRRVIDAAGVTFPVLMDRDRTVARDWSISALPSTVILDSRHAPRLIVETDVAWDGIEPKQLLDRLSAPENDIHVQQPTKNQGRQ